MLLPLDDVVVLTLLWIWTCNLFFYGYQTGAGIKLWHLKFYEYLFCVGIYLNVNICSGNWGNGSGLIEGKYFQKYPQWNRKNWECYWT